MLSLTPIPASRGRSDSERVPEAGKVLLRVRPRGETRRKLKQRGKITFRVKVTYRPSAGGTNIKVKRVTLKRRGNQPETWRPRVERKGDVDPTPAGDEF
jgi:hypothetical protein